MCWQDTYEWQVLHEEWDLRYQRSSSVHQQSQLSPKPEEDRRDAMLAGLDWYKLWSWAEGNRIQAYRLIMIQSDVNEMKIQDRHRDYPASE